MTSGQEDIALLGPQYRTRISSALVVALPTYGRLSRFFSVVSRPSRVFVRDAFAVIDFRCLPGVRQCIAFANHLKGTKGQARTKSDINFIDGCVQISVCCTYLRDHSSITGTFELVETQPVIG